MDLPHASAAAAALLLFLSLLLRPSAVASFNITTILRDHAEFSLFNDQLTRTNLSAEINERQTITVCAVDDSRMRPLINKNLDVAAMKNLLSLHVLVDYFDAKKLHQLTGGSANVSTMFQASGSAVGSSGIIKITNVKDGKVKFTNRDGQDNDVASAFFVNNVISEPYKISVIQISNVLNSTGDDAPSPSPSPSQPQVNFTANMSAHGCKIFAEILANHSSAQRTFDDNSGSGLTVFCPGDDAMKKFMPQFRNLSAEGKVSLLEYHGVPIYQTISDLRSSNKEVGTLASDEGKSNYRFKEQDDGDKVTIVTKVVTANVGSKVFDSPQQVAVYQVDKVLMPEELFNSTLAPTASPVPAPAPGAGAPKPSRHRSPPSPPAPPTDTPADSPVDGPVADQEGNRNGAARFNGGEIGAVILSFWFVILQL